jgi:RNA polymerase sigma-70 factor (ECF subfamily)
LREGAAEKPDEGQRQIATETGIRPESDERRLLQVVLNGCVVAIDARGMTLTGMMSKLDDATQELRMELTEQLQRLQGGDRNAMHVVMPLVYEELKKLASSHLRRQAKAVPLETTALVHEAYLKLVRGRHPSYENRSHFYGIASRVMRQVLVDTARARAAEKRSARQEVALSDVGDLAPHPNGTLLAMDDALQRLEQADPTKARVIEMRYFGGMTAEETSLALSIPTHTVRRLLRVAQAWLHKELAGKTPEQQTPRNSAEPVAPEPT